MRERKSSRLPDSPLNVEPNTGLDHMTNIMTQVKISGQTPNHLSHRGTPVFFFPNEISAHNIQSNDIKKEILKALSSNSDINTTLKQVLSLLLNDPSLIK